MDLEKMREMLEGQGLGSDKVEEILGAYQKEQEKLENTLSVRDTAIYLNEKLDDKWNEAKVRRFIRDGEIKPFVEPGKAKKLGYKIEKEELDRFIKEHQMTKEDWKKYAKELEKRVEELEDGLKSKNKPSGEENKKEVQTQGEGRENGNLTPSREPKNDIDAKIDAVIAENEELKDIPSKSIQELKNRLEKDGGFIKHGNGRIKNPMNKRRLHDTEEEALKAALLLLNE